MEDVQTAKYKFTWKIRIDHMLDYKLCENIFQKTITIYIFSDLSEI